MTREERQIPKEVMDLAITRGFDSVKYQGHIRGIGDVYSPILTIYPLNQTGLPKYIICKEGKIKYICDRDFSITKLL